jgi:hypothetical protein
MKPEEMEARIYRLEDCLHNLVDTLLAVEDSYGVNATKRLIDTLERASETLYSVDLSSYL